jgi:hypothetical protein
MADDPCRHSELVSLRDHFERLLVEHEKRELLRAETTQRALEIQQQATEHWRENANEWRSAMDDRERNFLSRGMGLVIGLLSIISLVFTIFQALHK